MLKHMRDIKIREGKPKCLCWYFGFFICR